MSSLTSLPPAPEPARQGVLRLVGGTSLLDAPPRPNDDRPAVDNLVRLDRHRTRRRALLRCRCDISPVPPAA